MIQTVEDFQSFLNKELRKAQLMLQLHPCVDVLLIGLVCRAFKKAIKKILS